MVQSCVELRGFALDGPTALPPISRACFAGFSLLQQWSDWLGTIPVWRGAGGADEADRGGREAISGAGEAVSGAGESDGDGGESVSGAKGLAHADELHIYKHWLGYR